MLLQLYHDAEFFLFGHKTHHRCRIRSRHETKLLFRIISSVILNGKRTESLPTRYSYHSSVDVLYLWALYCIYSVTFYYL
jgi:hypothetical protein